MKVKTESGEEIDVQLNEIIEFFESFVGSQEELQQLMNEVIEKVQNGTLYEDSELVDIVDMTEEEVDNFEKGKLQ
jgi:hypothetical protein